MRTCEICGCELEQGFTDEQSYCCEDDFEQFMDENFGEWRENDHEDEPHWNGGYYDFKDHGEWVDSGFYWTEGWED